MTHPRLRPTKWVSPVCATWIRDKWRWRSPKRNSWNNSRLSWWGSPWAQNKSILQNKHCTDTRRAIARIAGLINIFVMIWTKSRASLTVKQSASPPTDGGAVQSISHCISYNTFHDTAGVLSGCFSLAKLATILILRFI